MYYNYIATKVRYFYYTSAPRAVFFRFEVIAEKAITKVN